MVFRKRGRMIDVGELTHRGVVRIPKEEIHIPTDNDGFVELGKEMKSSVARTKSHIVSSNADFFGIKEGDKVNHGNFSSEAEGYNKREVDSKITELDNKIYKLENRIELLEKKLDVNQESNSTPVIGW